MILTVITHDRGTIEETAFQALTFARSLASDLGTGLHAAWVGTDVDTGSLGEFGVETVHVLTHEGLDDYSPEAWGAALAQLIESIDPKAVIAIGSDRGNELMAHVGAITGLPMVANAREVTTGDTWTIVRTRWGGSLLEEATLDAPTKLATVTEHAVEAEAAANPSSPETASFNPDLVERHFATKVVDRVVRGNHPRHRPGGGQRGPWGWQRGSPRSRSWQVCSGESWGARVSSPTTAGVPTQTRSARPAPWSLPTSTSPAASAAPFSTGSG